MEEVRIKDITGTLYKFTDVDKTLENREQIILRFVNNSEAVFTKKNIIYALRDCGEYEKGMRASETDLLYSNPKQ